MIQWIISLILLITVLRHIVPHHTRCLTASLSFLVSPRTLAFMFLDSREQISPFSVLFTTWVSGRHLKFIKNSILAILRSVFQELWNSWPLLLMLNIFVGIESFVQYPSFGGQINRLKRIYFMDHF